MSFVGFLEEISVSKIHHSQNQLRANLDNIHELAYSIKQHGLLQPIVIRTRLHFYEVVAGNRRLAAVKLLKLRKIGCHIVELTDQEAFEVALIENVQHKTFNPIEEAIAFNQYVKSFGWGGISELARRIGKSQEFVTKRIQLLRLPERVREEIIRQRITPSVALEMLPLETETIVELAEYILKNPLTKKEVRHMVRKSKEKYDADRFEKENFFGFSKNKTNAEKELYLLDKSMRKSIAVMKSTLVNFDDIVNNVNDQWILKELLMQYRSIIHGDIDTFLKLRKKLKSKMPKGYFSDSHQNERAKIKNYDSLNTDEATTALHLWATKGVWQ